MVLVVENDEPIRVLTRCVLELSRFDVRAVAGVGAALDLMSEVVPDLVVLDLELPDDADAGLLGVLRSSSDHEGVRVVGIAGATQVVGAARELDVVLRKPRALALLPGVLDALLVEGDEAAGARPAIEVGDRLFIRDDGEAIGLVRALGRQGLIASVQGEDVVIPYRSVATSRHHKLLLDLSVIADESLRALAARRA